MLDLGPQTYSYACTTTYAYSDIQKIHTLFLSHASTFYTYQRVQQQE